MKTIFDEFDNKTCRQVADMINKFLIAIIPISLLLGFFFGWQYITYLICVLLISRGIGASCLDLSKIILPNLILKNDNKIINIFMITIFLIMFVGMLFAVNFGIIVYGKLPF
jgi:Na+-translocating ferredoxin:NAD+ oxidoreductase RnfD subunit